MILRTLLVAVALILVPRGTHLMAAETGTISNDQFVFGLNAGGPTITDDLNRVWLSDKAFVVETGPHPSGLYKSEVEPQEVTTYGPDLDPEILRTERYGPSFAYRIPLPNGRYQVTLHFAEIYWDGPEMRVFDSFVEGTTLSLDLDLWREAGKNQGITRSCTVEIEDGSLDLDLVATKENAKIAAVAVTKIN